MSTPSKAKIISWDKCRVFVRKVGETGSWTELPTPVEDSTQLSISLGDKIDATIEGGEAEASRRKASSYELTYELRYSPSRKMTIKGVNGVVDDEYSIAVIPKIASAYGFIVERSSVTVEDPYNTADGSNWKYTHTCLVPDDGKIVKWGVITASDDGTVTGTGEDFDSE